MFFIIMSMTIAMGIFIIVNISDEISDMNADAIEIEVVDPDLNDLFFIIFIIPLAMIFLLMIILMIMNSRGSRSVNSMTKEIDDIKKNINTLKTKLAKERNLPISIGNFHFSGLYDVDNAMEKAREYRDAGYRVKLRNFIEEDNVYLTGNDVCGVYVSDWSKDEETYKGEPKWMSN